MRSILVHSLVFVNLMKFMKVVQFTIF